jgi:hypothetical protein
MRSQATRRLALLGVLLAASAAIAGAALARPAAQSPIQQALANTYKAGTNHFNLALTIAASGKQYSVGASGAFDLRHKRGAFTVDTGSLLSSLGLEIGGAPVPSKIGMVLTGNVLYIHLPQLAKQYPGKEWLKVDPKTLPKSQTGGADLGGIVSAFNPQQALMVLGAATSVQLLGPQTISGIPMVRYRTVIDVSKLSGAVTASQRAQVRKLMQQLGLTTVTMDVWIDKPGYIRAISTAPVALKTSTTSTTSIPASATLKLVMTFGAYGQPVIVAAPPATKTVDIGPLLQQQSSG